MNKKLTCPKNHLYDGNNSYIDPQGNKHCRTCMRQRTKNWYHNKNKIKLKTERLVKRQAYQPPPMQMPKYKDSFGHWLSGFADGESSFTACCDKSFNASFTIKLRADDASILRTIQKTLGVGRLYYQKVSKNCKLKANPCCVWQVRSIKELYTIIIPHFDTFPLQSKKSRDYITWRKIVVIAISQKRGKGSIVKKVGQLISPLVKELKETRKYTPATDSWYS